MGKIAFVFSGQGAQYVGMGKEICEKYIESSRIFDDASESLGFDLKKMVFEGDDEILKITENTQPAILTTSYACLKPLLEANIKPDYVSGLSLGEYTAHVVAGTMDFKDVVRVVRKRGKYMQEAVPLGVGTMAAIIGLDSDKVIQACNEAKNIGVVEPANFNCPGQIVVAGEVKAIDRVVELCKEYGARRAIVLPVSAPFHCSMLKPAGERLREELDNITFNEIQIPVISNVTAELVINNSEVKELLVNQVSSPVRWEESIKKLIEYGVDTFVEIGPGKVLSGFIKKIDKTVNIYNVEDVNTLEKAITQLG